MGEEVERTSYLGIDHGPETQKDDDGERKSDLVTVAIGQVEEIAEASRVHESAAMVDHIGHEGSADLETETNLRPCPDLGHRPGQTITTTDEWSQYRSTRGHQATTIMNTLCRMYAIS